MEWSGASPALVPAADFRVEPVIVHVHERYATVAGTPVWLTPREFEVLAFLAEHPARPMPRLDIHRAVWGPPVAGFKDRSVEVHIVRLRRKLAAACADFAYIHTHHNVGYRFEPELAGGAHCRGGRS